MINLIPFVLFVTVPIIEIALFITIGGQIGIWATLGLVVLTAMIGTVLLRQQGLSVLARARAEMDAGRMPLGRLADGLFLLVAAVLLLTPGFMTDALGFLLFVPAIRQTIGRRLLEWIVGSGRVTVATSGHAQHAHEAGVIDGEAIEIDVDDSASTGR